MYSNRVLFSLVILLTSCTLKEQRPSKTWLYKESDIEVLNGKVNQLIQTDDNCDGVSEQNTSDTVDFDIKSDIKEVRSWDPGIVFQTKYVTKYDSNRRRLQIIARSRALRQIDFWMRAEIIKKHKVVDTSMKISGVYEYDKNGHVIKRYSSLEDLSEGNYSYNKYNSDGDMIETDSYLNSKLLGYVTKLTYDNKHMVIEETIFHNGTLVIKTNYSYLSFDSKGNWTKRKESYDVNTVTTIRKITYY